MLIARAAQCGLDADTAAFYQRAVRALNARGVRYLVGGAYAFARYTGIERHTKDFDVFVRPEDCPRVLDALAADGCQTEVPYPHWIGKAYCGDNYVDVIFSSGNGLARVDDEWFAQALDGEVLGLPVKLCPVEEMIWSKAFVMERERFDGADVMHLLRAQAEYLDWPRLLARFGADWRVLLSHLLLFGFVYPSERERIPAAVMRELLGRAQAEADSAPSNGRVCQGTLLSREQYLPDVGQWGYADARRTPRASMTPAQIAIWTEAIGRDELAPERR
jgi:hypothetical protein